MLPFVVTFVAFIVLYALANFFNSASRVAIQRIALLKYKEGAQIKYKLLVSKKKILKELIYQQNLNHLDIPVQKFEAIYFFNRDYLLKVYDGNAVRFANDTAKEEIMMNVRVGFLNVYNKYAASRFVSFVRGDYENDILQ